MDHNGNSSDRYYKLLRRKLVALFIALSIAPMIIISGVILYNFQVSYHSKVHDHLKEVVQKHKQNIDNFLNEKLSDIRFLAQSYGLDQLSDEAFLTSRLSILQREYDAVFEDLGVINDRGLQVAYAGPYELINAMYANAQWFQQAMRSPYFISDVFLGLRGLPHFIISVRTKSKGGRAILRATIDFGAFNTLVENLRIGKTGNAFILNKNGKMQTKSSFDFRPDDRHYKFILKHRGEKGDYIEIVERPDRSGKMKIYAISPVKDGDWLMVFQQDSADAFADLNRTKQIAFLIMLSGALLIISVAVIASDKVIIRMTKADREKELMNQQVIETGKLASIGELASGIAHEINNPVAIMVEEAGWVEDLLEEEEFKAGKNLDEFMRALAQIKTQGKRCKEITHKLLSFARKTDPRTHDVQINVLIKDMIEISVQRAKYGNVVINADLAGDLPLAHISEPEMQQVFLNLINNALDALEKKGGVIDITSRLEGEKIVVEVADNGPGIARSNLARIFDPFFTTKPVGKGTGLGLSICYGIIKKMGGDLDVRSVIDKGATFSVRIPLAQGDKKPSDLA